MKATLLQLLLLAALAMPQVSVSCGDASSCCKMNPAPLQQLGPEISHRVCCCGIGDCSSQREPLAMARVVHQGDYTSIQAPVVLLSLFPGTEERLFSAVSRPFPKRGYEGGSLFFARLFCVFRC